ncbi:penicillin-binding protein 1C [Thiocystis violacea]|uniref:penicillin-binding protein 1C n=1 Tax=Thiocystis violacea TaxID=13725 RepID=UPI00190835BE|nr:penicillin-binding protein 1C [Thiocystis violacea]MBK1721137.1 penicillin-binding protein 1C [Thiocystis violacea]
METSRSSGPLTRGWRSEVRGSVETSPRLAFRLRITALLAGLSASLLALAWLGVDAWIAGAELPDVHPPTSTLVLDRKGELLRPFTVEGGRWRLAVALGEVDPEYLRLLQFVEDRRFRAHAGVDVRALLRAAWQWATQGHIVSGGSTLTMQAVRLLDGRSTRHLGGKLRQIRAALALERQLSKDEILTLYLTLAPYGGNLEGIHAAAIAWLGKEPGRLTTAEAALLVALPQAPEARRPDRDRGAAQRARDVILQRAQAAGLIDGLALRAALAEPLPRVRRSFPMLAAHLAERQRAAHPGRHRLRLTIDAELQRRLERLVAERVQPFGDKVSIALLLARHADGEVLVSIGSADPIAVERQGYVDMTRAPRSPGSTLKPLIYGLAFEDGIAHPESLIEDRPSAFAGYVPTNFDREFQGTVTLRRALQRSLNIPAITLLDAVGPARLVARLRRAGARPALPNLSPPGLAIGLGGVGVTLTDLVRLYAALARGGQAVELREIKDAAVGSGGLGVPREFSPVLGSGRVLDARAAWYVSSILSGVPTPGVARAGSIAFKTGTSYGYRDAWALGFDGRHVAGVWVGRPDGAPVPGLIGIDAAAPILLEAFARLGPPTPLAPAPPGILLASSRSDLPPPMRRVRTAASQGGLGSAPDRPEIAYPPEGARVDLGLSSGRAADLVVKVRGGVPPFTWLANGAPFSRVPFGRSARWTPDGPGFVTLSVIDGQGGAAQATVFVE